MNSSAVRFPLGLSFGFWGSKSRFLSRILAASCFLLALAFLAKQAHSTWQRAQSLQQTQLRNQSMQAELEALHTKTLPKPKTSTTRSASPQEIAQREKVATLLNLPWSAIFNELEQNTPPEIAVVSLEPGNRGSIKMQCESLHLDLLLTYASTLEHIGPFGKLIYSHHETNERDPNKPARLSFELASKVGGAS